MFLNYLSLVILLAGIILVFYTFIYIHDLPYKIAKQRNHPQKEAIHVAGWLSIFTLHAIWPLVFIWSITKGGPLVGSADDEPRDDLRTLLKGLDERLRQLEKSAK